jgi:hypothetical protein
LDLGNYYRGSDYRPNLVVDCGQQKININRQPFLLISIVTNVWLFVE